MPRVANCGRYAAGHEVAIVRRGDSARWTGITTCGSVWACPVCSARIWAERGADLTDALERWHERGGRVVMVTLTMRHHRDALAVCWEAASDAWAAATGRNSAARRAKHAAGVAGWVRRVEATWGPANGWHLHVHALLFVPGTTTQADADTLGRAMFGAWAARLTRVGLTPIRDSGGLRAQLLDLDGARAEVGAYVTKGTYTGESAALELTGGGKHGRGENLTPWDVLDAAIAGDKRARAVWGEWEQASLGRRALTWSRGLRDELGLGEDVDDHALVDDVDADADEVVAIWAGDDWAAIRDADAAIDLLEVAEAASPLLAGAAVRHFCRARGLPAPRGPDLQRE